MLNFSFAGLFLSTFGLIWVLFYRARVWLSIKDIFKKKHIEPPKIDTTKVVEIKEPENPVKINLFGGFFTGLTLIALIFIIIYYIYVYIDMNVNENSYLITTSSIMHQREFNKEKVLIYFDFNTLRNFDCKKENIEIATSNGIKIEKIQTDKGYNAGKCFVNITVTKNKIFNTGDTLKLSLKCSECYTSDVGVSVQTNSAYFDKKSRDTNNITLTNGFVMKGNEFSTFYFELMPSVFDDLTESDAETKYGYMVASFMSPQIGSTTDISSLYLKYNVNIQIQFTLSLQASLIELTPKFGTYGYIGIVLGALSGFVGAIGIIVRLLEYFYYKFKFRGMPTISDYQLYFQNKEKLESSKHGKEKEGIKDDNDQLVNDDYKINSTREANKLVSDRKDYEKPDDNEEGSIIVD